MTDFWKDYEPEPTVKKSLTVEATLKLALEALEQYASHRMGSDLGRKAITSIKEALAQPEHMEDNLTMVQPAQEPVGHLYTIAGVQHCTIEQVLADGPLYTAPPQRTWVGLTKNEVFEVMNATPYADRFEYAEAIEATLKEKNHD